MCVNKGRLNINNKPKMCEKIESKQVCIINRFHVALRGCCGRQYL